MLSDSKLTNSANFTRYNVAMQATSGPLPASRARLAAVLRAAKQVVSIDDAEKALGVDRETASKLLSRWRGQGWLRRVGPGLYVSVPLDLAESEQVIEDPWVLVPSLFGDCYVGGWTAAHHWDLTEQLFNDIVVLSTQRVGNKLVTPQGVTFLLHHIAPRRLFGLKTLWRGSERVGISDPARTMIDMLALPILGGGIDHVADCLVAHRASSSYDEDLLIRYADQYGNGTIFKRLGFLAETRLHDSELVDDCKVRLTQGYAQLDPALAATRLHTSWRLWVPDRFHNAS